MRPFPCKQCKYRAKRKQNLENHVKNVHDKARKEVPWIREITAEGRSVFRCLIDDCQATYSGRTVLKGHIRAKHTF